MVRFKMPDGADRLAVQPAFGLGLRWSLLLSVVTAVLYGGCNGSGNSAAVSGAVTLDGKPISAEVQIEPLDLEGNRVGRPATSYADQRGQFSASVNRPDSAGPLTCSVVVRISELSSSGLPAAFDENAPREKVVRLRRIIRDNEPLSFVLTR